MSAALLYVLHVSSSQSARVLKVHLVQVNKLWQQTQKLVQRVRVVDVRRNRQESRAYRLQQRVVDVVLTEYASDQTQCSFHNRNVDLCVVEWQFLQCQVRQTFNVLQLSCIFVAVNAVPASATAALVLCGSAIDTRAVSAAHISVLRLARTIQIQYCLSCCIVRPCASRVGLHCCAELWQVRTHRAELWRSQRTVSVDKCSVKWWLCKLKARVCSCDYLSSCLEQVGATPNLNCYRDCLIERTVWHNERRLVVEVSCGERKQTTDFDFKLPFKILIASLLCENIVLRKHKADCKYLFAWLTGSRRNKYLRLADVEVFDRSGDETCRSGAERVVFDRKFSRVVCNCLQLVHSVGCEVLQWHSQHTRTEVDCV